jgi:2-octaprenyl-6-methoxyphenol hydroxylase
MTIKHEKYHEGTAVEHFTTNGVFAILPTKDQNRSSIVWATDSELAKIYVRMTHDELLIHLSNMFGDFLGGIAIDSNVQSFPLSARIAKKYFHNKIVLVGDSAHTIHPLAGQGLNQGIKDIKKLVEIVARNISLKLPIDRIALEEYQNSRKWDNYLMYLATDNLDRIFSNNIPVLSQLRKLGLGIIESMPSLKNRLVKLATGL